MLTELGGKSGTFCGPASKGELRCPLIVRSTSEDVVTGNMFGTLRFIDPRWWLPDLLNEALRAPRFRRQAFRRFRIDVWEKQPEYPRDLLEWDEGRTEIDAVIRWENPPTTVFVEMKYRAPISAKTTNNDGIKWPSDQLIRNIRVGLHACGWFEDGRLLNLPRRDFVQLVVTPSGESELVERYRDPQRLAKSIPHSERLRELPKLPFIGIASYGNVTEILLRNERWLGRCERGLSQELARYLDAKLRFLQRRDMPKPSGKVSPRGEKTGDGLFETGSGTNGIETESEPPNTKSKPRNGD